MVDCLHRRGNFGEKKSPARSMRTLQGWVRVLSEIEVAYVGPLLSPYAPIGSSQGSMNMGIVNMGLNATSVQ